MYPILRFTQAVLNARRAPPLSAPFGIHVSRHRVWPWDLDPWCELNNGRTLTLYDLGRIPMAIRLGITDTMRRHGWGFTVAGNTVRYRRRIRMLERFTQVSRTLGWDGRFLYMEQSMWIGGDCANHMLLRVAIVGRGRRGIITPAEFVAAMGHDGASPPLPGWVRAWIDAEAQRPWPPALPRGLSQPAADLPG